ncbi:MAG: hypothetical protein MJ160_07715 [Treponema sp.]|nr:hypothetical protein [Treponema sp.]
MKVTVIWSSPNKEGLTASAKNNFSEYILPALVKAGESYADKLENGFDMYY